MKSLTFAALVASSLALVGCGSGSAPPPNSYIGTQPTPPPAPAIRLDSSVNGYGFWASRHKTASGWEIKSEFAPKLFVYYPLYRETYGGYATYIGPFKGVYSYNGTSGQFRNGTVIAEIDFTDRLSVGVDLTLDTGKPDLPFIRTYGGKLDWGNSEFKIPLTNGVSGTVKGGFTDSNGTEIVGHIAAYDFDGNSDNSIVGSFAATPDTFTGSATFSDPNGFTGSYTVNGRNGTVQTDVSFTAEFHSSRAFFVNGDIGKDNGIVINGIDTGHIRIDGGLYGPNYEFKRTPTNRMSDRFEWGSHKAYGETMILKGTVEPDGITGNLRATNFAVGTSSDAGGGRLIRANNTLTGSFRLDKD